MYQKDQMRLPRPVYYQCIWIVKDMDRLYRLGAMQKHKAEQDDIVLFEDENCITVSDRVISEAVWKLSCIRNALEVVPEEYRLDTIESIADGTMPVTAHENTWKKWRRAFIGELASHLNLI